MKDPARKPGMPCKTCDDECNGHYLSPLDALAAYDTGKKPDEPPSIILKSVFEKAKSDKVAISEEKKVEVARDNLLPVNEVDFWLGHLEGGFKKKTDRRAKTRKRKKEAAAK